LVEVCKENGALSENDINGLLAMVDALSIQPCSASAWICTASAASSSLSGRTARYMNAATKLQRTMAAQIEALARLRRGGEQNVIIKHVHVHDGGQAIVGNVQAGGGRDGIGNSGQAHALAFSDTEMRCEVEVREALPIAGGLG
jgi:hypothetical protein